MTVSPLSTLVCFSAAARSIAALGAPVATKAVMPPAASTSSISFHASSTSVEVSASI